MKASKITKDWDHYYHWGYSDGRTWAQKNSSAKKVAAVESKKLNIKSSKHASMYRDGFKDAASDYMFHS